MVMRKPHGYDRAAQGGASYEAVPAVGAHRLCSPARKPSRVGAVRSQTGQRRPRSRHRARPLGPGLWRRAGRAPWSAAWKGERPGIPTPPAWPGRPPIAGSSWTGSRAPRCRPHRCPPHPRLGVRPASGRPVAGWDSLTETEARIADLVATGLTNRQVAREVFMSRHTVDTHLRHIFRKLAIVSRVQLARLVAEQGPRQGARPVRALNTPASPRHERALGAGTP